MSATRLAGAHPPRVTNVLCAINLDSVRCLKSTSGVDPPTTAVPLCVDSEMRQVGANAHHLWMSALGQKRTCAVQTTCPLFGVRVGHTCVQSTWRALANPCFLCEPFVLGSTERAM